jgi:hypothetical protein
MADNDFRAYRSRGPLAPPGDGRSPRAPIDDPLAELARLIGQDDPVNDYNHDPAFDEAAPDRGSDWAADDRHEPSASASERYDAPPTAEPYPSYHAAPALPAREADYDAPPRFDSIRNDARDYAAVDLPRDRDDGRQLPAFLPRGRNDARYEHDDAEQSGADDQAYALEDYDEEVASPRRRGGFVVVAAVLGLAILGTAGAFAYRAMFGGSMLPSLPPIIKAEDGPTRIMPNYGETRRAAAGQADASTAGSGEKLVSREEKPVDVPAPVPTAPRVVSTIPIFPAPTAGAPGAPPANAAAAMPNVLPPVAPAPAAPAPAVPAALPAPPPTQAMATPEPKKIHTLTIRPDQPAATDTAAAPPPPARTATAARPAAASAPKPSPAPVSPAPKPSPAPQAAANAPLEIVPPQGDAPPAARMRTAAARPTALAPAPASAPAPAASSEPAASAGGGYAVQVTSQRSEAEAQSAYRALAAKYPDQLGGHAPLVRRADLGSKGIYYRALVGPFASMEQAAGICSSLKAAGGSCIVQKN